MIKETLRKYSVLICVTTSVILVAVAASMYPGGSIFDKNSSGFDWSKNFLSNLFAIDAVNGLRNPGRIWAVIGMAFHAVGYGLFFINMSVKIPSRPWANSLKFIGAANILLIFLVATPLHDVGVLSIVLTLLGLFTITVFALQSKLKLLKVCCIICLLTFYGFFFFYGFGYLEAAVILQKVCTLSSMLLVLGLEYFTSAEDFISLKPVGREIAATNRSRDGTFR